MKSPRWNGHPMEVGPLARVLMLVATGHERTRELVGSALKQLDLPPAALFSTLGRTAARALETQLIVEAMQGWFDELVARIRAGDLRTFNADLWEPSRWPSSSRGVGFCEAPRGGLAHWIVIDRGRIANYQAVVPSTWNAGPRDPRGRSGPYEAALEGHVLQDPSRPLEILRTIHSFDPCIACAVHLVGEDGRELGEVRVV
jgi:hydrogenase large subunit